MNKNKPKYQDSSDDQYIDQNSFTASNLERKEQVVLGKYDPAKKHLSVYPGLNIKGTCNNNHCPIYLQPIWVKKGYGNFDFAKLTVKNFCPTCDRSMNPKKFTNIGYKNAKVHIKGCRMDNDQQIQVDFYDQTINDMFTKYFDNPEDLAEWIYMQITVEKKT